MRRFKQQQFISTIDRSGVSAAFLRSPQTSKLMLQTSLIMRRRNSCIVTWCPIMACAMSKSFSCVTCGSPVTIPRIGAEGPFLELRHTSPARSCANILVSTTLPPVTIEIESVPSFVLAWKVSRLIVNNLARYHVSSPVGDLIKLILGELFLGFH